MWISFIVLWQAFLARLSGGGMFAKHLWSALPEVIFSVPYALIGVLLVYQISPIFIPLCFIFTWRMMELGHGTFYDMEGYRDYPDDPKRKQTLEYITRPIYKLFSNDIRKPAYSWLCMGLKGLLIGLPLGWFAIPHAILWPSAYWLGRKLGRAEYSEWISGAVSGLLISLTIGVYYGFLQ